MAKLLIVRKSSEKLPKLTKTQMAEAMAKLEKVQRVKRDELVELMLGGGFNKLPVYKQSEIDKADYNRNLEGWEVPQSCLGRKGNIDPKTRESIRIWVKDRLEISPDMFSVVLVD